METLGTVVLRWGTCGASVERPGISNSTTVLAVVERERVFFIEMDCVVFTRLLDELVDGTSLEYADKFIV